MIQLRQKETKGENTYVQDYQWCGCPVCGSVCVRNDYGKYVMQEREETKMIKASEAKMNANVAKAKQQEVLMELAEQWLDETVSPAIEQASKSGLTFCNVDLARFDHNEEALTFIGRTLAKNGYTVKRFAKCTTLQIRWED